MDPLSVASSIANVISLAISIIQIFTSYLFSLKSHEKVAISRTYGRPLGWLIVTFFGNTATEYERIERVVLRGSDAEALRFRDSVITECNMTAVAVSPISSGLEYSIISLIVCAGRHYCPGGAHSVVITRP